VAGHNLSQRPAFVRQLAHTNPQLVLRPEMGKLRVPDKTLLTTVTANEWRGWKWNLARTDSGAAFSLPRGTLGPPTRPPEASHGTGWLPRERNLTSPNAPKVRSFALRAENRTQMRRKAGAKQTQSSGRRRSLFLPARDCLMAKKRGRTPGPRDR
jgi:hypothetical protein